MFGYRSTISLIVMIVSLGLAAPSLAQDKMPSGSVDIDEVQVAFLLSGNLGGGTLRYKDKAYRFQIGGLGVGGIGASSIDAEGEVYNLKNAADLAGAYGEARAGVVVGDISKGDLWLENPQGVVMRLKAKRAGAMLSLGADAIVIKME
jgi:hypothetical protein